MGKPEEDEEEGGEKDEEGEGEELVQPTSEDDTSEEVIEVPTPEIPKVVKASVGVSLVAMPQGLLLRPSPWRSLVLL